MKLLLSLLFVVSGAATASSKTVVEGAPAKEKYEALLAEKSATPESVVAYTNMFFGDDKHPQYGRLWFTTAHHKVSPKLFCYEYDYRDAGVKEYLCEVYE